MSDLSVDRHGRVAELRLARNALNTLSPDFVAEIDRALAELAADPSCGAVVLASAAPKFFSAGWDLSELLGLDRESFRDFYRAFGTACLRLATLPKPSVAAIGGFAVAGGAILALACDWRVMSAGKAKLGLNEVDLGLPLPLPAALLVRGIAGWRGARDMLVAGRLYTAAEAEEAGLVDSSVEGEGLLAEALSLAEGLAAKPGGAVALMKELAQGRLRADCLAGREEDEARFAEAFFRPETRELLAAAAERLVPR